MKPLRVMGWALLIGLSFGLAAMPGSASEKLEAEINELLTKEKAQMKSLKARIRKQDKALSVVGAKETSLLKNLSHIGDRLKLREKELKVLRWNKQINQKKIDTLSRGGEQAEKLLERQKKVLGKRLRSIYKEGNLFPIKVLFSAENLNDLLQRFKYMERVASYDSTLFRRYAGQWTRIEEEKKALMKARAELLELENAALKKQNEVQREKGEKSRFLKKLTKEKSLTLQARKELQQASHELTDLLSGLKEKLVKGEGLEIADKRGTLKPPVRGKILNKFGKIRDPQYDTYIVYNGINIKTPKGTPVRAVFSGKVLYVGALDGYGNIIIVGHGKDYHSLYGHMDEIITEVGKTIRTGQIIGKSGDTGSLVGDTLYFEIRHKGKPIEPTRWLQTAKR